MLLGLANSKKQGDVGMGVAIGWFSANGYTVCVPLTDSQDYDLVIDNGNKLCKVQVKTTRFCVREGIYQANLKVCGGNRSGTGKTKLFQSSFVDFLFIVTQAGIKYLIPSGEVLATSAIVLGSKWNKYIVV